MADVAVLVGRFCRLLRRLFWKVSSGVMSCWLMARDSSPYVSLDLIYVVYICRLADGWRPVSPWRPAPYRAYLVFLAVSNLLVKVSLLRLLASVLY